MAEVESFSLSTKTPTFRQNQHGGKGPRPMEDALGGVHPRVSGFSGTEAHGMDRPGPPTTYTA